MFIAVKIIDDDKKKEFIEIESIRKFNSVDNKSTVKFKVLVEYHYFLFS